MQLGRKEGEKMEEEKEREGKIIRKKRMSD